MADSNQDQGTIQSLLERLNEQRIPRATDLKNKVDSGEKLSDLDINFLAHAFSEANEIRELVSEHKELHTIAAQMISLYHHITEKALDNEKKS